MSRGLANGVNQARMNRAELWFKHLNWAMQRRVAEVAASDEDMAHVLLYFPLPFRADRTWKYPIRGEVPDGLWDADDLAAIRAYVAGKPTLKAEREQERPPWTDLTLAERRREPRPRRDKPAPLRKATDWQAVSAEGHTPDGIDGEHADAFLVEMLEAWVAESGILGEAGWDSDVGRAVGRAFSHGFGAGIAYGRSYCEPLG